MNGLEFFNEIIVLGTLYHMMIFTEGLTQEPEMLYNVGWSMNLMLLVQFLVNMIYIGYGYSVAVKSVIKNSWLQF